MNGNTAAGSFPHSKSASMVSEVSQESQPHSRISRTPWKTATFGKRSNSMRRNPKSVVTKQGWLHKQGSNGVKQWNKRWFVLTDRCLFYYKDDKEDTVLGSLPLLSFQVGGVEPLDNITRKFAFKKLAGQNQQEILYKIKKPISSHYCNSNIVTVICLEAVEFHTRSA